MHIHKWSKWQVLSLPAYDAGYGLLTQNLQVEVTAQERNCSKCGKVQRKRLVAV
jgi:hypothetical protein